MSAAPARSAGLFALSEAEALAFARGTARPVSPIASAYSLGALRRASRRPAAPGRPRLRRQGQPRSPGSSRPSPQGRLLRLRLHRRARARSWRVGTRVPRPLRRPWEVGGRAPLGARDGRQDPGRRHRGLRAARGAPRSAGGRPFSVNLRVQPGSGVSEASRIIGGSGPSAFGVDEEELAPFLEEAARFPRVRIAGLQVFAASNERSAERLLANHRIAFAIGERLQAESGSTLDSSTWAAGSAYPTPRARMSSTSPAFGSGLGALLEANLGSRAMSSSSLAVGSPGPAASTSREGRPHEDKQRRALRRPRGRHRTTSCAPCSPARAFRSSRPRASREPAPHLPIATTLAGPLCTSLDRLGSALLPPLEGGRPNDVRAGGSLRRHRGHEGLLEPADGRRALARGLR